jgi:hypothetical protein
MSPVGPQLRFQFEATYDFVLFHEAGWQSREERLTQGTKKKGRFSCGEH